MPAKKANSTSFKAGASGNPSGRPPGTTPRAKFRLMVAPDLPEILKSLVDQAKTGDTAAIKIIFDRIVPAVKPSSEDMVLRTTGTLKDRGQAIVTAMLNGKLTPEQAQGAISVLVAQNGLVDATDLATRLDKLESLLGAK